MKKLAGCFTGWTAVQGDVKINYDLENSPLQIKTDNEGNTTLVHFYSAQEDHVSAISLYLWSPPEYRLFSCSTSSTLFPTDLPSETDKIWTITKSSVSGAPRVVIHCNGKEILNVVMSNTTCSDESWSTRWSKKVDMIKFDNLNDSASDYYRPGTYNLFDVLDMIDMLGRLS